MSFESRWIAQTGLLGLLLLGSACGGGGSSTAVDPAAAPNPNPTPDPTFSVSGTIPAASGTAVDSDVNDTGSPFVSNDLIASAQEIPNPVILGGYANEPGEGPQGRSFVAGDPIDLFRVSLGQGQVVRLSIAADPLYSPAPNLDLRLLDVTGGLIVSSTSVSSLSEEILVPFTDTFLVEVSALDGAANYVLTIGQAPAAAGLGLRGPIAQPEFVPGEIIVRFAQAELGINAAVAPEARVAALGMRALARSSHGEMLMSCKDEALRDQAFRALGIAHLRGEDPGIQALDADERLRRDTQRLVEALRLRADVASADLNYIRRPSAIPDDAFFSFQWHYDQIDLPAAWDATSPNSGVIVGVIDTGIKSGHPDLATQLVPGYDFIRSTTISNDGDGCDGDPEDPGDRAPGGSSYHGTHVAGTVAARTSLQAAANADGVAGVAWNARIMPLRVLGVGGGTDFDIMQAILYAAGRDNFCGEVPANAAHIVNMSLGGPGFNSAFDDLVDDVRLNDGLILVAAAGNESSSAPSYPAAYTGVISVAAVGPTKALAPYSNFGSTIAVAAPGGDFSRDVDGDGFPDGVLSTQYEESTDSFVYAFSQGTSMASPHVAGVIALMLGVNPALNPFDIDNLLAAGSLSEDLGSPNFFGAGLIDAVDAVNAASEEAGGGPPVVLPVLRIDPDALNFGVLADQLLVSATNGGGGAADALELLGVSFTPDSGGAWLSVTEVAVDPATGLGSYRVDLDRGVLADGLYTGTLSFDSDANDVEVPVIMQVGDAVSAQANAGHQFVLLVSPATFDPQGQVEADAVAGVYSFTFTDVEPGDYLVITGTDLDNDFVICDSGEACGAYPTLDTILPITVDSNTSGIDFLTGFASSAGPAAAGSEVGSGGGFSRMVERRFER